MVRASLDPRKTELVVPQFSYRLEDLAISPGDWVGFDNSDLEMPCPFIIGRAGKDGLSKELKRYRDEKIKIVRNIPKTNTIEEFYFHAPKGIIELWSPKHIENLRIGDIRHRDARNYRTYVADSAYVGVETIVRALNFMKDLGFDLYANWLESELGRK